MAKDFIEQRATRTRASAETRGRRTYPADQGPCSPAEIDKLYRKSQIASNLNVDGGDGLMDRKQHAFEVKIQKPQSPEDQRLPDYDNDVPLTGRRAWLRGGGKAGAGHLDFDSVGIPGPATGSGRSRMASGKDATKSPFSAAYRKGAGEGF
jgi:hypothetical protein